MAERDWVDEAIAATGVSPDPRSWSKEDARRLADWGAAQEIPEGFSWKKRVGEWELTLVLTVDETGLVCKRFEVEPVERGVVPYGGVTSSLLHSIPLAHFMQEAANSYRSRPGYIGARAKKYIPPKVGSRRGRAGLGDEHFQTVAMSYLVALSEAPGRPNALLREWWKEQRTEVKQRPEVVRDWVHEARRRGFLTEGQPGRAGALPGPNADAAVRAVYQALVEEIHRAEAAPPKQSDKRRVSRKKKGA